MDLCEINKKFANICLLNTDTQDLKDSLPGYVKWLPGVALSGP
jgi:hypothetical protein